MKYPDLFQPAFDIIREFDPETFKAMSESDWDIEADAATDGMGRLMGWYASTNFDLDRSFTSPTSILGWALDNDVDVDKFAAVILVHEWHHTPGGGGRPGDSDPTKEIPAFAASSAFARKLPGPDGEKIAALSDVSMVIGTVDWLTENLVPQWKNSNDEADT